MEKTSQNDMRNVFNILKYTFFLVPVLAGLDKFVNFLTDWKQYLNPDLMTLLPISAQTFMYIVGIIEIVAGFIVLRKPAVGGYIVMAWLCAIALSLIAGYQFLDVAVRDLVMALGAFTLARMARAKTVVKTKHEEQRELAFS